VAGYFGGEGLTVHTTDCSIGRRLRDRDGERWMDVDWADQLSRPFESAVTVLVHNSKGALAQVAQSISSAEADITHIDMGDERGAESTELHLLVSVRDRLHLADVLRTLKRAPAVLRAARVKP
jgi:GTP pyrophosphokinase/guanosine-3',5'-bis(diphosphate) 3'-pyrophosphohydrolase